MRLTMWQILCMVYVSWDRQGWDYLKLNLQLNDNLAPIQHFRGCECGVYRQCLRSILEKNAFGELTVEYINRLQFETFMSSYCCCK